MSNDLTHFDDSGNAHMVDVGAKDITERIAVARATVVMQRSTLNLIRDKKAAKGDVLAVVDPRAPGRYLLGVECDGASYHSSATARDRDRLRQHVLESLGWKLHRIWSTDWWFSSQKELEKLHARLQESVRDSDGPPVVDSAVLTSSSEHEEENGASVRGEMAVPNAEDTSTVELPKFLPTDLRGGDSESFYEPIAVGLLRENLLQIIANEGPVADAAVFEKVARAWGLKRTGGRIVERLRQLVPKEVTRTQDGNRTFYWPPGTDVASWNSFRVAGENEQSKRHVSEVALEEIGALIKYVVEHAGSSSRPDLARTACKLFGMTRTRADAEARVDAAIERLLRSDQLREEAGYVRLNRP